MSSSLGAWDKWSLVDFVTDRFLVCIFLTYSALFYFEYYWFFYWLYCVEFIIIHIWNISLWNLIMFSWYLKTSFFECRCKSYEIDQYIIRASCQIDFISWIFFYFLCKIFRCGYRGVARVAARPIDFSYGLRYYFKNRAILGQILSKK